MSKVSELFQKKDPLLIGYLPVGFPSLQESIDAAIALVENGVDVLELGVPYSDPVMDGEVIQKATQVALSQGFRLTDALAAVKAVTRAVSAPVLLMTYFNPVIQYGVDKFAQDLAAAGGAGLITPDLIPDEAAEWITASDTHGLERVFLAAPSSTDERLSKVISQSTGFVYAVSTMGITGARSDVDVAAQTLVTRLKSLGAERVGVGVGISTAQQVTEVLRYADAAIVGSALVKTLADSGITGISSLANNLAAGK